ncbi:hypothetical protein DFH09DRAFT_1275669 [Mycena vulgaris]|nr:hypothetical protein DFH09DRAFT_1275669 [Mycena vulgaris]
MSSLSLEVRCGAWHALAGSLDGLEAILGSGVLDGFSGLTAMDGRKERDDQEDEESGEVDRDNVKTNPRPAYGNDACTNSQATSQGHKSLKLVWQLCRQNNVTLGQHALEVQVKSKGQPFYFDSLIYTPAPTPSFYGDPALSYSPGWKHDGQAVAQTANMQVTLNFHGTLTTLIGISPNEYPPNTSSASYTTDGGAPVTFAPKGLASATDSSKLNTILFTTPTLPDGSHNLAVIYGGDLDHTPLGVKQFYVTNTTSLVSQISVSTSEGPSAATQSAEIPTGSAVRRSHAGPIAGGVVADVLMLALLAAVYFWLLRRKRRDAAELSASVYPVAFIIFQVNLKPFGHQPPSLNCILSAPVPRTTPKTHLYLTATKGPGIYAPVLSGGDVSGALINFIISECSVRPSQLGGLIYSPFKGLKTGVPKECLQTPLRQLPAAGFDPGGFPGLFNIHTFTTV